MKGIAEWLASVGLSEYAQRFADNAIDLSVLRDLTEQDLKDLGVLLGHRRRILRAIAELDGVAPAPTETATEPAPLDAPMFPNKSGKAMAMRPGPAGLKRQAGTCYQWPLAARTQQLPSGKGLEMISIFPCFCPSPY
jgi:hypothetical protein